MLTDSRGVLGEDQRDTLTAMNNLTITLWQMKDTLGALRLMRAHLTYCFYSVISVISVVN